MLLVANAGREFNALRQQPAGLGGCGCGGGCSGGCNCHQPHGVGRLIPTNAANEFIALAQRPSGLGQFTSTSASTGTITSAPSGSFAVAGFDLSWLENTIALFGYTVPFWALGAGVAAAFMMLGGPGGGRRRR